MPSNDCHYGRMPSVLWRCWLGSRKGIRPVKNCVVGYWHGYLSGARCRLAYGPADATATHVSCFSKIRTGFTFPVLAHPGSPGQRAIKRVCVCVCVCACACVCVCVCTIVSKSQIRETEKKVLSGSEGLLATCHAHTLTYNRLTALWSGIPRRAGTRRNLHPLTPIRKKNDSHRRQGLLRDHPLYGALSQRGLLGPGVSIRYVYIVRKIFTQHGQCKQGNCLHCVKCMHYFWLETRLN